MRIDTTQEIYALPLNERLARLRVLLDKDPMPAPVRWSIDFAGATLVLGLIFLAAVAVATVKGIR